MWDPAAYRRFGAERARPFFDLVAQIHAQSPRAVVDLGCGPGELTAALAERWPHARVTGIDSSPEMIERATALGAEVDFRVGDLRDWRPGPDTDVLVTNAALQWVPGHAELVEGWVGKLPAGAWFAMQVPGNFGAPSHRALREVARDKRYAARLGNLLRPAPVHEPAEYATRLTALGATVDAWETTYVHLLPACRDEHPVLRWMDGTALRPVRAALSPDEFRAFCAALEERLASAYPENRGVVPFPFRRIFVVARV